MANLRLRFSKRLIPELAGHYEWERGEGDVIALRSDVQHRGYLTKSELEKVAFWKSPRSAGHVKKNSGEFVREVTRFALSAKDERARVESLTLLDGVRWPSASVILHLYHRDEYPILDFRALWSVSIDVPLEYDFDFWWEYVKFCRSLTAASGVESRTLDRALWQYSKENQKPSKPAKRQGKLTT